MSLEYGNNIHAVHLKVTAIVFAIDLSHLRRHIEFNADENEAVRDRLSIFSMARV